MDEDPWGSSTDPWSTPSNQHAKHSEEPELKDSLNVPKDFVVDRRASAASDPWGATEEPTVDNDISYGQTRHPESPAPKTSWIADDEGDAWGATEEAQEVSAQEFSAQAINFEPEKSQYIEDPSDHGFGSTPVLDQLNLSTPFPNSISSSTPEPKINPLPPIRPSSPPAFQTGFGEEDDAYNPFSNANDSSSLPTFTPQPTSPGPATPGGFPNSPSFGDDAFGGFSSALDQPEPMPSWAPAHTGGDDDGWGSPTFDSPVIPVVDTHKEDAWGEEARPDPVDVGRVQTERQMEDEWEQARKAAERKQAVAPVELIAKLEREWKALAQECYGIKSFDTKGDPDEEGLSRTIIEARDALFRELTTIPPEIDTFQHNLSMSMTWAKYQDSLSRTDLDTRNSILALVSRQTNARASRRSSSEWQKEWQTRTPQGETAAAREARNRVAQAEERPRWSFWGRKQSTPVVPLTTSGGGVLEVKAMSPSNTGGSGTRSVAGAGATAPAEMMSPITAFPTSSIASPLGGSINESMVASVAPLKAEPNPVSEQVAEEEPAASAVGRFFGRFRKPRVSTPSVDISNQDLELTKDDFSFLDQVPAIAPAKQPEPGFVDLLSLNGPAGKKEEMASLESMLSSKPVALPSRLAPPPRSNSRSTSTSSLPKVNSRSSSHIDLFDGLDFNAPSTTVKPTASSRVPTPSNGLFELMASGSNTPVPSPPVSKSALPNFFGASDNAGPSKPSIAQPQFSLNAAPLQKPAPIEDDDGFGDFGDFTAPPRQQAGAGNQTMSFDDFEDFDSFAPHPSDNTKQSFSLAAPPLPAPSGLPSDFSSFLESARQAPADTLVQNAAQRHGRWPAPPSPIPDALSPPPAANHSFFPRLEAPLNSQATHHIPPQGVAPSNFDLNLAGFAMSPPMSRAPSNAQPSTTASIKDKRATLSAQDLSFFDSL